MRLIALDIGERRIGIAISESGLLATPHSILQRKSKKEDFARLGQLISTLRIERVIVGLPYSLTSEDKIGPQARRIQRYAETLAKTIAIPIEYFDESYSTVEARSLRPANGRRGSKQYIDDAAAAVILQNYLDAKQFDKPS